MDINYSGDRKTLGYEAYEDTQCGAGLVLIINQSVAAFLVSKSKNRIRKLYFQFILIVILGTTILPVAKPCFDVVGPERTVILTVNQNDLTEILLRVRAGFTSNKGGFNELPDSKNFSYDMEQGRGLKKQARKVLENPIARKEVLSMLEKFGNQDVEVQEKPLKGFHRLTELKNSGPGPRIFVYREKNEKPLVVGFCMRNDLDAAVKKLKGKFN